MAVDGDEAPAETYCIAYHHIVCGGGEDYEGGSMMGDYVAAGYRLVRVYQAALTGRPGPP